MSKVVYARRMPPLLGNRLVFQFPLSMCVRAFSRAIYALNKHHFLSIPLTFSLPISLSLSVPSAALCRCCAFIIMCVFVQCWFVCKWLVYVGYFDVIASLLRLLIAYQFCLLRYNKHYHHLPFIFISITLIPIHCYFWFAVLISNENSYLRTE